MSFPQGNGHERDFMNDKRVYIMDVYNRHIYPGDRFAKRKLPSAPRSALHSCVDEALSPERFLHTGPAEVTSFILSIPVQWASTHFTDGETET